jgi:uncharacterized membrane protein YeiH
MPATFEVPLYLDYLAVFTWALSGAILGVSKGYDLTGVFVVALLSSVGGSLLRDGLFLNETPPVVSNPFYLPLILLVTVLVGLFSRLLVRSRVRRHTDNLVDVIDAIGTPAFAVIGMQLSLAAGIPLPGVVLIGAINGVGGGVLRDLLVGDVPAVVQPGHYFALLLVFVCVLFLMLTLSLGMSKDVAAWFVVGVFFVARALTVRMDWRSRPLLPPQV